LSDPGDGLENNGRRVLTYADLRARYRGVDGRPPTREIELHLIGNMERFIWGFNGQKFSSAEPIELKPPSIRLEWPSLCIPCCFIPAIGFL